MEPAPPRFGPLALLVVLASALCWWPSLFEPHLHLPFWLPVAFCAASTASAVLLRQDRWLVAWLTSTAAACAGLVTGRLLWLSSDPIDGTYVIPVILFMTALTLAATFAAALSARFAHSAWVSPRALLSALAACALYGPVVLAYAYLVVVPPLARRERLAEQRFFALKSAIERSAASAAATGEPHFSCREAALQRYYHGPALPPATWRDLGERPTLLDGYRLTVDCRTPWDYDLDVRPDRFQQDGIRAFRTGPSRRVDLYPR